MQFKRLADNRVAISVPVEQRGAATESLTAVFLMGGEPIESFVVILQLVAGLLAACRQNRNSQTDDWASGTACAMLDLVAGLGTARDLREGTVILVNAVKDYLGCERVAIGLRKGPGSPCKLLAISGMSDLNLRAEMPQAVQDTLAEAVRAADWSAWPPDEGQSAPVLPSHSRLSALSDDRSICSAPLRDNDENVAGAWVFWGLETADDRTRAQRFALASSGPIGGTLHLLQHGRLGAVKRYLRKSRLLRRKSFWVGIGIAALALLSFWPYRITGACALEPVKRRSVVAPYAGVFEKSLVRPGDVVAANQKLASMDGRELRMELAGIVADIQRARKSRDVNMAAGKTAAAQIDKLEMRRLEEKRHMIESRLGNLDIKSPEAGIVVSGDLERSEGAPLTAGQALYEIAPLDKMIVEVAIKDEDVASVKVGQKVAVRFDAYPGKVWTGRLDTIHPRSEIRDSHNVFVGEVSLEESGEVLRPGMKGSATVTTSSHWLLWIMFHKAWYVTTSWLGM